MYQFRIYIFRMALEPLQWCSVPSVPNIDSNDIHCVYVHYYCFLRYCCWSMRFISTHTAKKQVYDSSVIKYPEVVHQHGLVTSVLGLHMQLDSSRFEDGLMRVKCLTSVSPLIAMHSSSSSSSISDENAAEARESGLSAYSGNNRKTNYAQQQRKPALTDSREVFLLGKCIIKKHLHSQCNAHFHFDAAIHCSTPHNYVIYLTLRSLDFGSQPFISR